MDIRQDSLQAGFAWTPLQGEYGLIAARGEDARSFLHAQLTNDVAGLDAAHARLAGWCSAKGRLLATMLVIPIQDGLLLQLASDLVAPVLRRLSMFVLRARVKLSDESAAWAQAGVWGAEARARLGDAAPAAALACKAGATGVVVALDADRFLVLDRAADARALTGRFGNPEDPIAWRRLEIAAGRPHVVEATQDLFVPQMVNLERLGGVDFKKGCYPGQEIVARTQYRGQLKRRMVRAVVRGAAPLAAGQELFCDDLPGQAGGNVVNAARIGESDELLAVVNLSAIESKAAVRVSPGGAALEILPLSYAP
jgi:folate-binding protein YgfZ